MKGLNIYITEKLHIKKGMKTTSYDQDKYYVVYPTDKLFHYCVSEYSEFQFRYSGMGVKYFILPAIEIKNLIDEFPNDYATNLSVHEIPDEDKKLTPEEYIKRAETNEKSLHRLIKANIKSIFNERED